jgi:type II secretory pathway pseudopilin PulG
MKGFTLIEIIVACGILGLMAIGIISFLNPVEQINRSKDAVEIKNVRSVNDAVERYITRASVPPWCTQTCPPAPYGPVALNVATNNGSPSKLVYQVLKDSGEVSQNFIDQGLPKDFSKISLYSADSTSLTICFSPDSSSYKNSKSAIYINQTGAIDTTNACQANGGSTACYYCLGKTGTQGITGTPTPTPTNIPFVPPGSTPTPIPPVPTSTPTITPLPTSTPTNTPVPPTPTPTPGPVGITLHGLATNQNATASTSFTLSVPTQTQVNDVIIAHVAFRGSSTTITEPSGWIFLRRDNTTSAISSAIYYKVASDSEPASYTWTLGTSQQAAGGMASYGGVTAVAPIDTHSGKFNANTTTMTATSVTTTSANDKLLFFGSLTLGGTVTGPAGMTQEYSANTNSSCTTGVTAFMADIQLSLAGSTGNQVGTAGCSTSSNISQLVALK